MTLQLPPPVPIDRTRAGILTIALGFLGTILRLPSDTEVAGGHVNPASGTLGLEIIGGDMPPHAAGAITERVSLTSHVSRDGGDETVHLAWSHKPDEKWLLTRRPLPMRQLAPVQPDDTFTNGFYWVHVAGWRADAPPVVAEYTYGLGWAIPGETEVRPHRDIRVSGARVLPPEW
jgi:hypothetical protein